MIGVSVSKAGLFIVTEYISGGDLRKHLKATTDLSWKLRVQIATDCLCALSYLHSKKLMHRDIKSKNVCVFCDD
jgi:serine/threonine protein kinase